MSANYVVYDIKLSKIFPDGTDVSGIPYMDHWKSVLDVTKINQKPYTYGDVQYTILNYVPTEETDASASALTVPYNDRDETPMYRSIVLDSASQIVSFSPPKSIPLECFIQKFGTMILEDTQVTEIVEGTMINLWYDSRVERWEISTKNAVGGNYTYFRHRVTSSETTADASKHRTFRDMFIETIWNATRDETLKIEAPPEASPDSEPIETAPESSAPLVLDLAWIQNLRKGYSYSFVLQHPDNHIVLDITSPRLYLVAVFQLPPAEAPKPPHLVLRIPESVYMTWDCLQSATEWLYAPNQLDREACMTLHELRYRYSYIPEDRRTVGVMVVHAKTGIRTKIINQTYQDAKDLRGNHPNLLYQYLCLRRMRRVDEFLEHFPRYAGAFAQFQASYLEWSDRIYDSYVARYIKRTGEVISKRYMPMVYRLHHLIYLPSIQTVATEPSDSFGSLDSPPPKKPKRKNITRFVVQEFLNGLEPGEVFYYLNPTKTWEAV